ncbi:MAG: ankyrin repeat domain-containing protein [Candidatus Bilamarchaeaceae archaeon]
MNDQKKIGEKFVVLQGGGKNRKNLFDGELPVVETRPDNEVNKMLISAVQNLDADMVERALKAGAYPGLIDSDGNTLLHFSGYEGNYKISKLLIDYALARKIDIINVHNKQNKTPMDMVLDGRRPDSEGHAKVFALLRINKGKWFNPEILSHIGNFEETKRVIERIGRAAMSSELIMAAAALDIDYAKKLLRCGASIFFNDTATTEIYTSPLAVIIGKALESGLTDEIVNAAKLFVDWNAKLNAPFIPDLNNPYFKVTLIEMQAADGIPHDIRGLLKDLYDKQLANEQLFVAADENDRYRGESAIRKGASVDARDEFFGTSLHTALAKAHLDFAEFIVELNTDLTAVDSIGSTLIHAAAYSKDPSALTLIISAMRNAGIEPDLDAKDDLGNAPIHVAVFRRGYEMVEALGKAGADLNVRSDSGETPLHTAVMMDDPDMGGLLLNLGAEITEDVIKFAEERGRDDIADALMKIREKQKAAESLHTAIKNEEHGATLPAKNEEKTKDGPEEAGRKLPNNVVPFPNLERKGKS